MNKKYVFLTVVLLLSIVVFFYSFIKSYSHRKQTNVETNQFLLFSLDHETADYKITGPQEGFPYYSLTYYEQGIANSDETTTAVLSQLIGGTAVNLELFMDKAVRVSGYGYYGQPLCQGECNADYRPVLYIESVELRE